MRRLVDYTYYLTVFGGTVVPEAQFDTFAYRASLELNRLTFGRIEPRHLMPNSCYELNNNIKDAACAISEFLFNNTDSSGKLIGQVVREKIEQREIQYAETQQAKNSLQKSIDNIVIPYLWQTGLLSASIPFVEA